MLSAGALIALFAVSSCAYHVNPVGGIVPTDTKTIAISVFLNKTLEPSIDIEVTKAVVEEFLMDGRLAVANADSADIVVLGSVTAYTAVPAAYTAESYVQSYNVSIGVALTVVDNRTKKKLLEDQPVGSLFTSTYAVSIGDVTNTKSAKAAAMKNAARDLAASLRSRVLDGF
jgi:hypothetical protein